MWSSHSHQVEAFGMSPPITSDILSAGAVEVWSFLILMSLSLYVYIYTYKYMRVYINKYFFKYIWLYYTNTYYNIILRYAI